MAQVMEVHVFEASTFTRTSECLFDGFPGDRKHAAIWVTGQGRQCGGRTRREWNISWLAVLAVMQPDEAFIKKYVRPVERKDLAASHGGFDGDDHNGEYPFVAATTWFETAVLIAWAWDQLSEQALFFKQREPARSSSIFLRAADHRDGVDLHRNAPLFSRDRKHVTDQGQLSVDCRSSHLAESGIAIFGHDLAGERRNLVGSKLVLAQLADAQDFSVAAFFVGRDFRGVSLEQIAEGGDFGLGSIDEDPSIHFHFDASCPCFGIDLRVESAVEGGVADSADLDPPILSPLPDSSHWLLQTILSVALCLGLFFNSATFRLMAL
ncbi:hypothetical protein WI96_18295 [Burkholderia vietnamiensis]|nr:hypothetical protein WI96_18295 [Burkholderia vietnamiensis]